MNIEKRMLKLNEKGCNRSVERENNYLVDFLKDYSAGKEDLKFCDVGCGMGAALDLINANFSYELFSTDINEDLVHSIQQKGYNSKVSNILDLKFPDDTFDIVHCSHVIEHLGYPDVIKALDELFRITKPNGIVVIKSLLPNGNFYNDIDHVRPYYPETIMNYLSLEQQQQKASIKAHVVYSWYVQYPPFYYKHSNKRQVLELLRMYSWKLLKFPVSQRCHYGLLLKKG